MSAPLDRLPSAAESERCVVSCMMQAPDFAVQVVTGMLTRDDFSVEANGLLFEMVADQMAEGKPVDSVTVGQLLMDRQLTDKLGGLAYLMEVMTAAPNPAMAEHYAGIVLEKAHQRRIVRACLDTAASICQDPELWRDTAAALSSVIVDETAEKDQRAGIMPLREYISDAVDMVENAYRNRGHVTRGMATGYTDIDRITFGIEKGENIVIGGRPGMGKSALAVNLLEKMALAEGDYVEFYKNNNMDGAALYPQRKVLLVTLEMTGLQVATRILLGRSSVNLRRVMDGLLSKEDFSALSSNSMKIQGCPFYVWDAAGIDILDLEAKLKDFKTRHPDLAVVAIDHCGLLRARAVRDSGNATAVVNYISPRLKQLAKKLDVVMVTIWQLNREADKRGDKKPRLSDLKDSGAIEADADRVFFPYRPGYYANREDFDSDAEFNHAQKEALVVVAKNRGGALGELPMEWHGEFTRYESTTHRLLSTDAQQHQSNR